MCQRFVFAPKTTTVPAVLEAIGSRAAVRDLTIEEASIEDVVRRLWQKR